jgi:hypothetical protein
MSTIELDINNEIPIEIKEFTKSRIQNHIKMVGWCLDVFIDKVDYGLGLLLKSEKYNHDLSKFSKEEFNGYCLMQAIKYGISILPDKYVSKNKETTLAMDNAWEHHQRHNEHHPQYWTLTDQKMPTWAKIAMVCDHGSVSIENNSDLKKWEENSLKNQKTQFKYEFSNTEKQEILDYVNTLLPSLDGFQKNYLSIKLLKK